MKWFGKAAVRGLVAVCGLALQGLAMAAPVSVLDDDGQRITLPAPAQRIVSLAPHTTELLFDAGAGAKVVATVRYGDYPEAAKKLPQVGDAHSLDLEQIAALKPDLIVVWMHGNSARQIERLHALKLPIFHSEPHSLPAIADGMRRLGTLAGTEPAANAAANAFMADLGALRQRYSGRPPVKVFYQIWSKPLMTVNKGHLISDVISLCGGVNVFADQPLLVPTPSVEAVLATQPEVLATGTPDGKPDDSLQPWQGLKAFAPVARNQVIWLTSDEISRHTPRILLGARQMCEGLDAVRAKSK
ncbi:cobalamin-binding protein [Ideonella azotifigens]|uniref:Cobalamin-binding protein n=1 Tax=Ideonella azotifigens TaxID=513160 RepID=A0ABN1KES8_9BURK|nr:cobalamin-binding protein [Ideonella azotifigens]MCD2340777.1 cobalamin-binding protein [Ideonella azotifigens]